MLRFNILIPLPFLAILGMLIIAYMVAGIPGLVVIAVLSALVAMTHR
jgi:hypothetical protein